MIPTGECLFSFENKVGNVTIEIHIKAVYHRCDLVKLENHNILSPSLKYTFWLVSSLIMSCHVAMIYFIKLVELETRLQLEKLETHFRSHDTKEQIPISLFNKKTPLGAIVRQNTANRKQGHSRWIFDSTVERNPEWLFTVSWKFIWL